MSKQEDESKKSYAWGKIKQFIATMCLGPVSIGVSISWTSPVLPQLENQNSTTSFHLTSEEGSWVGAMLAIGSLVSAIPAGYLADRFGPKKCILGFGVPMVIFTLCVVFANDVITLCIGRFFSGMATGGVSVVAPMYISEIADTCIRGTLSSFFELLIYCGVITTATLGAYMDYITLTIMLGSITLVLTVVFAFFPESPTYLVKIDKKQKAEKALVFYKGKECNPTAFVDVISEGLNRRPQQKISIGDVLKSRATIRGLVACVGITCFQQLSGIDGILFYTVQIFQIADAAIDAYTSSIIISFVQLFSAALLIFIVEKAGRKFFLYVSAIGACVSLTLFALHFNIQQYSIPGMGYLPIVSMLLYNLSFAMGLGPIPWMINGELFSPEIKGVANGITIASNWIILFVITKTMPTMMRDWGPHYTFYTYSFFMLLCVVFIKFCVPETRGKTLEQIQKELQA